MMMNKKGQLIHLAVVLIGLALIIFMAMSSVGTKSTQLKGKWQTDFLKDNYLESEKLLLNIDLIAKKVGTEIIWELSENGGYKKADPSECDFVDKIRLWNNEELWCFPDIQKKISEYGLYKIKLALNNLYINSVGYEGDIFYGNGDKFTIKSEYAKYTFETDFAVHLGYNIDEYDLIKEYSQKLVTTCQNNKELQSCLDSNKLEYWSYNSCTDEEYFEENRKVIFCVKSPNLYYLQKDEESSKLITYHFALDFTPTEALQVESFGVSKEDNVYEIKFPQEDTADSYKVYYTNINRESLNLEEFQGKAEQIFVFPEAGDFLDYIEITELRDCQDNKEINQAYKCDSEIIFKLEKDFGDKQGYFAITTVKDDQESDINGFHTVK
jgi:hypothetical protein